MGATPTPLSKALKAMRPGLPLGRRPLLRRRKSPTFWSDNQLVQQVRATYVAPLRGSEPPFMEEGQVAGVVFHQAPELLPRRMIRWADKHLGGFVPYCVWGIWWSEYLSTCVAMGDEPFDTFRHYSGHLSEGDARTAARAFVSREGRDLPRDVAFSSLPRFGQTMFLYVVRQGPAYFE